MKKVLIAFGSIVLAALLFIGGVYANEKGWLNFTGDSQIEQAGNDVEEIMDILRQVNEGKISAEEAKVQLEKRVEELEDLNPSGLAKQNQELRKQVSELQTDLANVTEERNNLQKDLADITEERNNLQLNLAAVTEERNGLQTDLADANGYIAHLESELTRANEKVKSHAEKVQGAVEEARTYKDTDGE